MKGSKNIAFILPLLLECLFIYPFVVVDLLSLTWNYYALIVLYMSIFSLQLAMMPLARFQATSQRYLFFQHRSCVYLIIFGLLVYALGVLSNFSLAAIFSLNLESYFSLANESAIKRYSGNQQLTTLYKVGSIFAYFTAFSLGFLLALSKAKYLKYLVLFFFLLSFIDSFLMAARAGMMMLAVCFFSSFFTVKQYIYAGQYVSLSFSFILKALSSFIVVFLFFLLIQVFRGGNSEYDLIAIISHLLTWFVGYIPAFSNWIVSHSVLSQPDLGINTLAGIADLIGIKDRNAGIYLATDIGEGRLTNIYTSYRPLIEDFSLLSVPFVYFVFGCVITFMVQSHKNSLLWIFSVIGVFSYLFWSFVTSIFVYNTIFLSYFLFVLVFYITQREHSELK